jgi:hypothetical protein
MFIVGGFVEQRASAGGTLSRGQKKRKSEKHKLLNSGRVIEYACALCLLFLVVAVAVVAIIKSLQMT